MRTIPAFTGEFGLLVRYYVPQVHTLCLQEPCIVECEEGTEALYPAAAEHRIVERSTDHRARGGQGRPPDLGVPETRFLPEPYGDRIGSVVPFPIVACPRWMTYGESKNWDGWPELVWKLGGYDRVCAVGAPDSSNPYVHCAQAWRLKYFLDASIAVMRQASLVIATDAGLAHLAVLCGAPLLIVTYRGLVAPGPVIDSRGKVAQEHYWPVRLDEYYRKANHKGAPIATVDGWEDVRRVVDYAETMIRVAT